MKQTSMHLFVYVGTPDMLLYVDACLKEVTCSGAQTVRGEGGGQG